jgi:hypothetical protein
MKCIISNKENFQINPSVHNIDIRNKHHFHRPNANPSCYQQNTFYAGLKVFNVLPPSVTILKNDKVKFRAAYRQYLNAHSFYSVDEFSSMQR